MYEFMVKKFRTAKKRHPNHNWHKNQHYLSGAKESVFKAMESYMESPDFHNAFKFAKTYSAYIVRSQETDEEEDEADNAEDEDYDADSS